MEYTKKIDGNVCRVEIKGKFTFTDHLEFKKIFDVFSDDNINKLEIDVNEVEFVDSAALGLLLLARDEAKKVSKNICLCGPQEQVKKMFEISRFYELFDIVD